MTLFPLRPTHREARPEVWLPGACCDAKEIFAAACQALARLLGDRLFALYRRVDGLYLPEGRGLDQAPAFVASSSLVAALRRSQRPVMATGSCCALALRARLQPRDVEILDRLSAVALLPMVADGALLGFLCLARGGRPALGSVASAVTMLLAAAGRALAEPRPDPPPPADPIGEGCMDCQGETPCASHGIASRFRTVGPPRERGPGSPLPTPGGASSERGIGARAPAGSSRQPPACR